jgi:hypothetical protein
MPWTYNQRIQRVCRSFTDKDLLDQSQILSINRPLFFGQFAFSIGFSPVREKWYQFDDLRQEIITGLEGRDYSLHPNSTTLDFHVFSSDPAVLRWLERKQANFIFNHLRLVNESCWHLPLPRTKKKTRFFEDFSWRISFKDPAWGSRDNVAQDISRLQGRTKLVVYPGPVKPRTFLYVDKLSDVLMFKLMAAEEILDIEDRSSL